MGCSREKTKAEKMVDSIFHLVRSIDLEVWTGDKHRYDDIKENAHMIRFYLDELEIELGIKPKPAPLPEPNLGNIKTLFEKAFTPEMTPYVEPTHDSKEWNLTPIVPEKPKQ